MNARIRVGVAAVAAVLAFSSSGAGAASVALPQNVVTGFGSTQWNVTNTTGTNGGPFAGSCDSSLPSFGIDDARGPTNAGDAYDFAYNVHINNVAFVAPGSTVDLTGTTMRAGPVLLSGVNATVQYHFVTTSAVARIFVTLQNPGAAPVAVNVQIPVNWGSDGNSVIAATSSGDAVVTGADRWVISRDAGPSDPVNLEVFYGPGASVVPSYVTSVFSCSGTQGLGATYAVTVPAGGTRALMLFAGLGGVEVNDNTVASSQASATFFNSLATLDPDWTAGLTATQLGWIVNWATSSFTSCQAEGFKGDKLKLCQLICEVPQPQRVIDDLTRLWTLKIGGTPPCTGGPVPTSLQNPSLVTPAQGNAQGTIRNRGIATH